MPPADYAWHELTLRLTPSREPPPGAAHPLSVLEAIVKGIGEAAGLPAAARSVFRWPEVRAAAMRVRPDQPIPLYLALFGVDTRTARHWADTAARYFDAGQPGRGFMAELQAPPRKLTLAELKIPRLADEACLDFLTPLPFLHPPRGRVSTRLDASGLRALIDARLSRCFGKHPALPAPDHCTVLSGYWQYYRQTHRSDSQRGHPKYLNGCVGRLYLKGDLAEWASWLALCERINLGGKLSFGLGAFRLLADSPAYFEEWLADPRLLARAAQSAMERYDDAAAAFARGPEYPDASELAERLAGYLQGDYRPRPFQAWRAPRDGGGERRIERAAPEDLVILQHLAHLLDEVMEGMLADESIGYRKGRSRHDVAEAVRAALRDGYDHVLESDISDFFPSIDHGLLRQTLDAILPRRDRAIRKILERAISTGYVLDGDFVPRERGLALGSPLSPVLANLFLDRFDRAIKAHDVRLIRYADDFVILGQGRAAVEAMLEVAEAALDRLHLRLNRDKTAIRPVHLGFTFLGIRFGGEGDGETAREETMDGARKPFYLTERYCFLALNHDVVDISHDHQLFASLPLHRISEIIALAPCAFSSALVGRLAGLGIPLVLAGYGARRTVVIGGDSAQRYRVAHRQAVKFEALTEAGRLSMAQSFAAGKLENYAALVRQRYMAGMQDVLVHLEVAIAAIHKAGTVDVIRGLEGKATHRVFGLLERWIDHPDFRWHGRERDDPDRLNSLLNFGYTLLFHRIEVVFRSVGLNPYLGFLHTPNGRYEALVCDVQELFRPNVDRLIVRLINLKVIGADDFERTTHGLRLTREGRYAFLEKFAREMARRPSARRLSLGEAIDLQVRSLRDYFLEDREPVLYRWDGPELPGTPPAVIAGANKPPPS